MPAPFDVLLAIQSRQVPQEQRLPIVRQMALDLGLTPSFVLPAENAGMSHDHVVVEHGLQATAVLTFLDRETQLTSLSSRELNSLLTVSYNNLVDRQIFVGHGEIFAANNLLESPIQERTLLTRGNFESTISKYVNADEKSSTPLKYERCDDCLLDRVRYWRKILFLEIEDGDTEAISALINAIILVRASEDQVIADRGLGHKPLLELSSSLLDVARPWDVFSRALDACGLSFDFSFLANKEVRDKTEHLDGSIFREIVSDFYRGTLAPYDFDFSLLSKHALSKIYERYVTTLQEDGNPHQQVLWSRLPAEARLEKTGTKYTPLFIASFFAKFLSEEFPRRISRQMRFCDPACGSGIFLRTVLEEFCNPFISSSTSDSFNLAFRSAVGVDSDPNAVAACKLSLALLYLILHGRLPEPAALGISVGDGLNSLANLPADAKFDAIISNPPYIRLDDLPEEKRRAVLDALGADFKGRADTYLAFVSRCLEASRDGGFLCFVLPQTFLLAENAKSLRKKLAANFWIRCIVDLTEVPVFQKTGVYTVLLIAQKKSESLTPPNATMVKCIGREGEALESALSGREVANPLYTVTSVDQTYFHASDWHILSSKDRIVAQRLRQLPTLKDIVYINQGIVSGADDVFFRDVRLVPKEELDIYVPLVSDKEIRKYELPRKPKLVAFYPYDDGGEPLSEAEVEKKFPETWGYLIQHRAKLSKRAGIKQWWMPTRPRSPSLIRGAKIVTPHLVLGMRFALDLRGKYAVSRAPFISAKKLELDNELLKYVLACLNSRVVQWYMNRHGYKFGQGYLRLEVKTLGDIPIPHPLEIPRPLLLRIIELVDQLLAASTVERRFSPKIEGELQGLIFSAYNVSKDEVEVVQ